MASIRKKEGRQNYQNYYNNDCDQIFVTIEPGSSKVHSEEDKEANNDTENDRKWDEYRVILIAKEGEKEKVNHKVISQHAPPHMEAKSF
jgi:L-rhamnose mutarotase